MVGDYFDCKIEGSSENGLCEWCFGVRLSVPVDILDSGDRGFIIKYIAHVYAVYLSLFRL